MREAISNPMRVIDGVVRKNLLIGASDVPVQIYFRLSRVLQRVSLQSPSIQVEAL